MGGYTFTSRTAATIFSQLGGLDGSAWAVHELETGTSIRQIEGTPLTHLAVDSGVVPQQNGSEVNGVTWRFGWDKIKSLESDIQAKLDAYSTSLAKGGPTDAAARDLNSSVATLADVMTIVTANTGQTDVQTAKDLQAESAPLLTQYRKYVQAGAVILEARANDPQGRALNAADVLARATAGSGSAVSSGGSVVPGLTSSSSSTTSSSGSTQGPDDTGKVDETEPPTPEKGEGGDGR